MRFPSLELGDQVREIHRKGLPVDSSAELTQLLGGIPGKLYPAVLGMRSWGRLGAIYAALSLMVHMTRSVRANGGPCHVPPAGSETLASVR